MLVGSLSELLRLFFLFTVNLQELKWCSRSFIALHIFFSVQSHNVYSSCSIVSLLYHFYGLELHPRTTLQSWDSLTVCPESTLWYNEQEVNFYQLEFVCLIAPRSVQKVHSTDLCTHAEFVQSLSRLMSRWRLLILLLMPWISLLTVLLLFFFTRQGGRY